MTKKFITVNGVRKVNPEWKRQQQQGASSTTTPVPFANQSTALAVITVPTADDEEIVFTPTYNAAAAQYKQEVEPEIFLGGDSVDQGLEELNQILAKYEVPAGMLSKLLQLKDFDAAEIIVDDSGSMRAPTDAKGPRVEDLTRWWEAKYRISQMMELMAYVVSPPVTVRFLNRTDVMVFERSKGESPKAYINRIENELVEAFNKPPNGTTPAREALQKSLKRDTHKRVLRYFMGDGVPNGGAASCQEIERMLIHRHNPERNPFTFMSCTNIDSQTEWMKECEEIAPYCSEFDDYEDESREILKDQGKAFPYSYGLHLVAQIVAAFNPNDLDAMDESVPFTKQTLDNLLGYQSSQEEYKYYFDSFIEAQHKLQLNYDRQLFLRQLPSLYPQFESAAVANDVVAAAEYKRKMKRKQDQQLQRTSQQPAGNECCTIL